MFELAQPISQTLRHKRARMRQEMKNSVRRFFGLDEDDFMNENQAAVDATRYSAGQEEPISEGNRERSPFPQSTPAHSKVIPMAQRQAAGKASIHVLEPRVYSEAEGIADLLLRNEAVVLNFRRMEKEAASRILDFLQGTVYTLSGDIQEVGEGVFLFVPAAMEIAGIGKDPYEENYY